MQKTIKPRQISESFFLGAMLTVVGGFLDVYTYLIRGHVFANAQTGNIVLLALDLAQFRFASAFYYMMPIAAFAGGVLVSDMIRLRFQSSQRLHWRQITLAAEILLLLGIAFLPQGKLDVIANITISFICAVQVESFRKMNGNAYATTMCTGNLRSATESFYRYRITKDVKERDKCLQYFGILLFFIAGAALGCWVTPIFAEKSVLICSIILLFCFIAMQLQKKTAHTAVTIEI